jgi:hypothetical protein
MKTSQALTSPSIGLASLVRPRFSPGLLLEDEDLTAGVDYTRELNRLLFRSLFGCGVICGLTVKAEPECNGRQLQIVIEPGLALDCMGDPIHVTSRQTMSYDPQCEEFPRAIWVTACYLEKPCRPRDVSCSCEDTGQDGGQVERTRIRDGFEIKLYSQQPGCACSCEDPVSPPGRKGGKCCDDDQAVPVAPPPAKAVPTAGGTAPRVAQKIDDTTQDPKYPSACYLDHDRGVCACDCGCNCVVIAKLDLTVEKGGAIVESADPASGVVRFIRPVLMGDALQQGIITLPPQDKPKAAPEIPS